VTLFLDASAVVAMRLQEPDAHELADRLDGHDRLLWSPIVRWESAVAVARERGCTPLAARSDLHAFGEAYDAFRLYGKGSSHPARLNMGDCFAYACAKSHQAELLYKGDDFARTDLA
jgi:ribonuclease VapC